jgi:hypothetical protein
MAGGVRKMSKSATTGTDLTFGQGCVLPGFLAEQFPGWWNRAQMAHFLRYGRVLAKQHLLACAHEYERIHCPPESGKEFILEADTNTISPSRFVRHRADVVYDAPDFSAGKVYARAKLVLHCNPVKTENPLEGIMVLNIPWLVAFAEAFPFPVHYNVFVPCSAWHAVNDAKTRYFPIIRSAGGKWEYDLLCEDQKTGLVPAGWCQFQLKILETSSSLEKMAHVK